jgi:hypothetical protein
MMKSEAAPSEKAVEARAIQRKRTKNATDAHRPCDRGPEIKTIQIEDNQANDVI